MGYTCFYHLSGSHQHRRDMDSFNHRLFYHPVHSPAVYLCRLPVLYGTCIYCIVFAFDYLITHFNYNNMESLNKNGVSITQTPGEEKYAKCCLEAFRGQIYYQYDYRHLNGNLFSTLVKTLEECHRRRDEWLAKKQEITNTGCE